MDYQEFFSRYSYDRHADVVSKTRFGVIYSARETRRDNKVFIRIMSVGEDGAASLASEVEFVNSLPANPYVQRYSRSYRFQESTGEIDCAVMDYYELGNLTTLVENWKLDEEERSGLLSRILGAVTFLRENKVKVGRFAPETIFVSQEDGKLIPHLTDLSGVADDDAAYEDEARAFFSVSAEPKTTVVDDTAEEVATETEETSDTEESVQRTRKWIYLVGVIVTWAAIFALIFVLHRSRNADDAETESKTDTAKVEKVVYPADKFAVEEAAQADSVNSAKADSIAAARAADSIEMTKKHLLKKPAMPKVEQKEVNAETEPAPKEESVPTPSPDSKPEPATKSGQELLL